MTYVNFLLFFFHLEGISELSHLVFVVHDFLGQIILKQLRQRRSLFLLTLNEGIVLVLEVAGELLERLKLRFEDFIVVSLLLQL